MRPGDTNSHDGSPTRVVHAHSGRHPVARVDSAQRLQVALEPWIGDGCPCSKRTRRPPGRGLTAFTPRPHDTRSRRPSRTSQRSLAGPATEHVAPRQPSSRAPSHRCRAHEPAVRRSRGRDARNRSGSMSTSPAAARSGFGQPWRGGAGGQKGGCLPWRCSGSPPRRSARTRGKPGTRRRGHRRGRLRNQGCVRPHRVLEDAKHRPARRKTPGAERPSLCGTSI